MIQIKKNVAYAVFRGVFYVNVIFVTQHVRREGNKLVN